MAETAAEAEQRFERCSLLIARQRAIITERQGATLATVQWYALTHEFGELQTEINKLLGGTP